MQKSGSRQRPLAPREKRTECRNKNNNGYNALTPELYHEGFKGFVLWVSGTLQNLKFYLQKVNAIGHRCARIGGQGGG